MSDMVGGHAGTVIKKSGEEMEQIVAATLEKLGNYRRRWRPRRR